MNRYKVYKRKRKHIDYVRDYVCDLHNIIFKNALHGELSPIKSELYKKYSKYLKLLEFQNMNERLKLRIKQFNEIKYGNDKETRIVFVTLKPQGTVTTAPKNKE